MFLNSLSLEKQSGQTYQFLTPTYIFIFYCTFLKNTNIEKQLLEREWGEHGEPLCQRHKRALFITAKEKKKNLQYLPRKINSKEDRKISKCIFTQLNVIQQQNNRVRVQTRVYWEYIPSTENFNDFNCVYYKTKRLTIF